MRNPLAAVLESPEAGKVSEADWKTIRRGWYLGNDSFGDRLKDLLENALEGKRRQSYAGGALRAHDERGATALLKMGLKALEVTRKSMGRMSKGAPEKQAMAWLLRTRTAVSRRWVAERLAMGDESRVTQAVATVKAARAGKRREFRERLGAACDEEPSLK